MHLAVHACLYFILLLPLAAKALPPQVAFQAALNDQADLNKQLALNGIAVHSEFGREQFISALYSDTLSTNVNTLINTATMRMEMKILADEGMTVRRFSRMWVEGASINNDPALLVAQADNMVLFDNLFKGRLMRDDHLILAYQKTKGVRIILNNAILGTIADDKFFVMLLHTWIGKVPLSTDYKVAILKAGNVDDTLQSRFAKSQPTSQRVEQIAEWSKPTAETLVTKKSSLAVSNTSTIAQKQNIPTIDTRSSLSSSTSSTSVTALRVAVDEQRESSPMTSETLLARQFYISTLLKKIRSNIRYPKRANELGQGGSIRITMEIDRAGKVLKTQFVQGSQYALLNQAALDAIQLSTPLPPMPETLPETSFEFTVPVNFVPIK